MNGYVVYEKYCKNGEKLSYSCLGPSNHLSMHRYKIYKPLVDNWMIPFLDPGRKFQYESSCTLLSLLLLTVLFFRYSAFG